MTYLQNTHSEQSYHDHDKDGQLCVTPGQSKHRHHVHCSTIDNSSPVRGDLRHNPSPCSRDKDSSHNHEQTITELHSAEKDSYSTGGYPNHSAPGHNTDTGTVQPTSATAMSEREKALLDQLEQQKQASARLEQQLAELQIQNQIELEKQKQEHWTAAIT